MIKRYVNLFNLIRELPQLKDCLVICSPSVEWQLSMLRSNQYRNLKKRLENQHIKVIIEKESVGQKEYEKNKHI